ncbi:MAG: ABC transporter ATP-binding protein [Anaerolineae bacterium]
MINLDDVTFAYAPHQPGDTPTQVLNGCSLHLAAGQALAIMGVSGAGKSTLGYVVAGLAPRHTGGTLSGQVQIGGCDIIERPPDTGTVGLLFQDAATQLFNTSVEDEIAWGLEAMGIASREIERRIQEALARFDLTAARSQRPWALSGGQQKRLALAAIWAMRPRVLILDEPLSGLDPQGRTEVLAAIETLRQTGSSLLLMTLRPGATRQATEVSLLREGRLTMPAPTATVLADEGRLTEIGLIHPPSRWPDLGSQCTSTGRTAVEIHNLHFRYPDGPEVLRGINLEIPEGQFVALIGQNGAGKSTLVRHLNGLLRPTKGIVKVRGKAIDHRPTGEIARDVGYLFQRPEQQLFAATVRDEVAFGPRLLGLPDLDTRVEEALARFGLTEMAQAPPALLGYGFQRAVTLASLSALETSIVVLDEPSVGLDGWGLAQLLNWIVELRAKNATIILVTHELALARQADRIITLKEGRVVGDGASGHDRRL